ncbi:hypothetical protein CBR_g49721 [Chara braunii]|uniref:RIIa domain-containing protein n=1 Tax=Chara braunii TaxID=69332 RepID=A0A388M5X0_CHABU|nr:hypothetical protein CBR_g49721 [Chara braunii]|eukprot:GBG89873.1 hypothetical protein CBR_g49721 [Chara braunii]
MSSRCQQQCSIMPAFRGITKGLAKEILRNQPLDIYEFGAHYFTRLLEAQRKIDEGQYPDLGAIDASELDELLLLEFIAADQEKTAHYYPREIVEVTTMPYGR